MRNFFANQGVGNESDHITAMLQGCIGEDVHQTDIATAVNHTQTSLDQLLSELFRCLGVFRRCSMTGPGKYTDAHFRTFCHRSEEHTSELQSPYVISYA